MSISANASNVQATLAKLKDVQSPQAISMWPETIAWYIVSSIILIIIIWFIIYFIKTHFRKRKQAPALQMLHHAVISYTENPENSGLAIANISTLLRRIALAKFSRASVASLKNTAWLNFLDEPLKTTEFSTGIGKILITGPYQKQVETDITALSLLIERWIKRVL